MKKYVSFFLCIMLLSVLLVPHAFAEEPVQPRWSYIAVISADVTKTSIDGSAVLQDPNNYVTISLTLQKYNAGWHDQGTWSGSGYFGASASGDLNLPRGAYRIKIDVTVRSSPTGSILETATIYTEEKSIY